MTQAEKDARIAGLVRAARAAFHDWTRRTNDGLGRKKDMAAWKVVEGKETALWSAIDAESESATEEAR